MLYDHLAQVPPAPPCTAAEKDRISKSQVIRILDVVLIGPLMIWGGYKTGGGVGALLGVLGATTIALNAYNYFEVGR